MKYVRIFGAGLYIETPIMAANEAKKILAAIAERWLTGSSARVMIVLDDGDEINLNPSLISGVIVADPEPDPES